MQSVVVHSNFKDFGNSFQMLAQFLERESASYVYTRALLINNT
jgi:hypothetical protein